MDMHAKSNGSLCVHFSMQVLFVQGGASTQFSAIPLNLVGADDTMDVVVTGSWSKKCVNSFTCFYPSSEYAEKHRCTIFICISSYSRQCRFGDAS